MMSGHTVSRFAMGEVPSEAWKQAFLQVDTVGDDMSGVRILSSAVRRARHEHVCHWCGKTIPAGHHYMTEVRHINDEMIKHNHCLPCLEYDAALSLRAADTNVRDHGDYHAGV